MYVGGTTVRAQPAISKQKISARRRLAAFGILTKECAWARRLDPVRLRLRLRRRLYRRQSQYQRQPRRPPRHLRFQLIGAGRIQFG